MKRSTKLTYFSCSIFPLNSTFNKKTYQKIVQVAKTSKKLKLVLIIITTRIAMLTISVKKNHFVHKLKLKTIYFGIKIYLSPMNEPNKMKHWPIQKCASTRITLYEKK